MTRPDDVLFRSRVETFALVRKLLPIALLAGAMIGPLFRFEPTVAMWVSAVCFLFVLVGLLLVSRLPLYPAHTFGIEYRFEEEPFETGRRHCVRCGVLAESGTHRRYARQLVVLGVPFHTLEWGSNDFCDDCVTIENGVGSRGSPDRAPASEPTPTRAEPMGPNRNRETESKYDATSADREPLQVDRVRRVDRNDETTALELKRAFD
ncbi:hypothetical protein HYG81_17640 [Natrinema zhouii]|uniref:DUF8108 domain-containing protein n=1 Tax=Natrinema zhouii TaxID=1710539 RepID=A0A7D6CPE5_9EURY|nr:hypothetical protein [Natrinema zhouii]QLK25876.1 hypothetical protein HYG81_17640 [Natrinema zhouii]